MLGRRQHCARCTRPESACICSWIRPLPGRVALLVLQHPLVVAHAKGSARLLHMSVPGSRMVTGESFDAAALDALLHEGGRTPVLLYPATPGVAPVPVPALPPERLRLVALDGTWRKSRKMLHLNPALQVLPRLPLREMAPSQYRIRRAHAPGQLSTLEAACHALAQLEGAPGHARALLESFDNFVQVFEQQAGRIGANAA